MKIGLNGGATLTSVPVTVALAQPSPKLSVAPAMLRLIARASSPGSTQLSFAIDNAGGGGPIAVAFSVAGGSAWIISVSGSAPWIQANAPVIASVNIDTQGLKAGNYEDAILATTRAGNIAVPISLFVTASGPFLSDSADGVRFDTRVGNATSRTQQVTVRNLGDSATSVNWSAKVIRGADLGVLTNPAGVSTPSNPTSFSVRLSSTAASSEGGKSALIQVTDANAENSPNLFLVVADVAPATADPVPDPDPAGLLFLVTAGGGASAAQQITVNTTSSAPVAFSFATSTDDGAKWLTATANAGVTSLTSPATISVSAAGSLLGSGISTGQVSIAIGKIVRTVNVTAIAKSAGSIAASGARAAAACGPTRVAIVETTLPNSFSIHAGWPQAIAARVVDDCGNALTNASVAASFSNGDLPLALVGDSQTSLYTATWQPGFPTAQMTITIDATSGLLTPAKTQIGGNADPNPSGPPSLAPGGFLNNFNPQIGAGLAPGIVAQVYGDNLASSADSPTTTPLPTSYKGVEALIGGINAPIYYVSKNQITIQAPVELARRRIPYPGDFGRRAINSRCRRMWTSCRWRQECCRSRTAR